MDRNSVENVLTNHRDLIDYSGKLSLADVDIILKNRNYPTPEVNKQIAKLVHLIQISRLKAITLDNIDFRKLIQGHTVTTQNFSLNNYRLPTIIYQVVKEFLSIDTTDHDAIIESIVNKGYNKLAPYDKVDSRMRTKLGLIYAFLEGNSIQKFDIENYSDVVIFGTAYFLYAYHHLLSKVDFNIEYKRLLHDYDRYVLLKLMGYDKYINIDILDSESLYNFFSIHTPQYDEKLIMRMRLFEDIQPRVIDAMKILRRNYNNVTMPRFIYETKPLPLDNYLMRLPNQVNAVAEELGIVFPDDIVDKTTYILDNSLLYNNMLNKRKSCPDCIISLSDKEIIDKFGRPEFNNRLDLIDFASNMYRQSQFFITNENKLAYGNERFMDVYIPAELIRRINDNQQDRSVEIYLKHGEIISDLETVVLVKDLIRNIAEYRGAYRLLMEYLEKYPLVPSTLRSLYRRLTLDEKETVKELLIQLYDVGAIIFALGDMLDPEVVNTRNTFDNMLANASVYAKTFFFALPFDLQDDELTIKDIVNKLGYLFAMETAKKYLLEIFFYRV